jgi:hypothetical protein
VRTTTDWYLANPEALQKTKYADLRWKEVLFAGKWKAAVERLHARLEPQP